jgi:nicotinamide mononucleotide transporter
VSPQVAIAIETVAAIITLWSIWLAAKEDIWYYPTGIISLLMYTWVYFRAHLYAETGLQLICLALMIYGWYEWLHGGAHREELPVSPTPKLAWIWIVISGLALSALITFTQHRYTNNPAPLVDSSIAAWSIVAQLMTARKWIECWIFWMVINVVSIALYLNRHLYPTAALYVALLILAVKGWIDWRKSFASA